MSVQPLFAEPASQEPAAGARPRPESCTFIWEEPPVPAPRGRGATPGSLQVEWFATAALPQLKAHPGQYAKVFSFDKRSTASSRIKRYRDKFPGVDFIARASGTADGKPVLPEWSALYAAWVDGGDDAGGPVTAE